MHTSIRTFPRIVAALAAAMLVVTGVLLTPPGARADSPAVAAADTDDVTWTVRTESNRLGAERTSFGYTINPGATIDDGLDVANRGTEPLELGVYAADGFTTDSGQFDILIAGEKSVGVGAWVRLGTDSIAVQPGETVTVPFTVAVPDNATPGDYAGGIVTSLAQPDDAAGIGVDRRLGIRVSLRVGGDLKPSLAVGDVHVAWDGGLNPFAGGDAAVTYTLRNTGNTLLSAQQAATVAGPFGWFAMDAGELAAPPQLLPGESWTQTVTVPGVAALFLLTGTATATPIVTDASGTTSPLTPVVASGTGWAVPWTLLAILVVIVLLAIFVPRLLRRRRAAKRAREDARVQEAVAEALERAGEPRESVRS